LAVTGLISTTMAIFDLFVANGWCSGDQNNSYIRIFLMENGFATFEKTADTVVTRTGMVVRQQLADDDRMAILTSGAKMFRDGEKNHNAFFRNKWQPNTTG